MTEAGLRKVELARKYGSWFKLDAIEDLVIPDDLARTLAAYAHASQNFTEFPRSARRGILEWIANAKTQVTRAKRIDETARLADQNERANLRRPKAAA